MTEEPSWGSTLTVMTRARIYEKYHNVGYGRNKKLTLYQIPLSSSAAAVRRSCTATRDLPADARSSIVTRCKRRQKCARLNFSRMNHRFRGTHWAMNVVLHPLSKHVRCIVVLDCPATVPWRVLRLQSISMGMYVSTRVYHVPFNFVTGSSSPAFRYRSQN